MIGKVILTVCLSGLVLLSVYGGEQEKSTAFPETRNAVILRKIGHELLLSGGDSSSRILPLKKLSETEYQLFFETSQRISPDSFVRVVNKIATRHFISENFTAAIYKCSTRALVYATLFSMKPNEAITSCNGRILPKDCYYLQFSFAATASNRNKLILFGAGGLILLSALIYLAVPRHKNKEVPGIPSAQETMNSDNIRIGNTYFYPGQQYIQYKDIKTTLTPREAKLLGLLVSSANMVIDRDVLQTEIWEKEGVIVTRSLDMFVSKLRKKLQPDPTLKISVVHGKGYKLETGAIKDV